MAHPSIIYLAGAAATSAVVGAGTTFIFDWNGITGFVTALGAFVLAITPFYFKLRADSAANKLVLAQFAIDQVRAATALAVATAEQAKAVKEVADAAGVQALKMAEQSFKLEELNQRNKEVAKAVDGQGEKLMAMTKALGIAEGKEQGRDQAEAKAAAQAVVTAAPSSQDVMDKVTDVGEKSAMKVAAAVDRANENITGAVKEGPLPKEDKKL